MEARIRPNDASCASVRQPHDARGGGAAALGGRGAGGWPWPSSLRLAVGLAGRLCCLSSGARISPAVLAARTDSVGGVVGPSRWLSSPPAGSELGTDGNGGWLPPPPPPPPGRHGEFWRGVQRRRLDAELSGPSSRGRGLVGDELPLRGE